LSSPCIFGAPPSVGAETLQAAVYGETGLGQCRATREGHLMSFERATSSSFRRIRVLEVDQDLGAALDEDAYARARQRCTAQTIALAAGRRWWVDPADALEHLGFLVLRGVLLYRLRLADRATIDLVGAGDLVRPWPPVDEYAELFTASRWQVLESAELAVLDTRFLREAARWPELLIALTERMSWHARSLELRLAISQMPQLISRLRVMLWHLADRFGRVDRDGVLLPLHLSRQVLAELVGADRESVSRRLRELAEQDAVLPDPRGWRLRGAPPAELSATGDMTVDSNGAAA
jgi:CRP/FNR family transcriptional regulator, cyclic AMP receptor protein